MYVAGTVPGEPARGLRVAHVHPVLEHPEVRQAVLVEGDDLAVDEQVALARAGDVLSSGQATVMSLPLRLNIRSRAVARPRSSARTPSHLTSCTHSSPRGT